MEKKISVGQVGNNFYYEMEPHDIAQLQQLPSGCTVEVNLGKTIDLLGGNRLELSSDLIVNVVLINSKFLEEK